MGFFKRFKKPKANIALVIPNYAAELGEDLEILVKIDSEEEFDSTEVRLELWCNEKRRRETWVYNEKLRRNIRQVYWDLIQLHSSHTKVSDQLHLVPGFSKSYTTSVNIPIASRESYDGSESNITWSIKGVIAVDDRPDVTSKTHELQILRAMPKIKAQKSMEKIKCEYCDTLMDNTLSACPNCGAPRKK
ncbi:hypothetical protein E2P47_01750 [Candidatus Bathyarchaeota archaeon]|nr:hypothetical protein E2P47_01750 [Candidatus Bathyarchaeota archaeon]